MGATDCVALLFLDDAVTSGPTEVFDGKTTYVQGTLDAESFPTSPLSVTVTPLKGNVIDPDVWAESLSGGLENWYDYGELSVAFPSTTTTSSPCSLVGMNFPPPTTTSDGSTVYNGTADWNGLASQFEVLDPAQPASGATTTVDGKSFYTDQILLNQQATGKPELFSYTPPSGDSVDVDMWCDYEGTWYDWGLASDANFIQPINPGGGGGAGSGGCFDLASVIQTSGMSLTNPVSWVTGLAKDFGGVVEWVFVPCTSTWDSLTNQFGFTSSGGRSGCGATQPGLSTGNVTQWLGAGFTLITDGPSCSFSTMASEESAGETSSYLSTGDTFHDNGQSFSVDLPDAISEAASNSHVSAFFTILLLILEAVMGVFFFFAIKDMIQYLLRKFG